jgi:hypothetical protein
VRRFFDRLSGEEPEPVVYPDYLEIPTLDVLQAWRYLAQEWVELVESSDLAIEKKRHLIGKVVGQLYKAEQPLLASLGLEHDEV